MNRQVNFSVFVFLIGFGNLLPGVFQGILDPHGKEFRMFPYAADIPGRGLLAVAEALLDKIGWIIGFFVVVKFHELIIAYNTTPYNTLYCIF